MNAILILSILSSLAIIITIVVVYFILNQNDPCSINDKCLDLDGKCIHIPPGFGKDKNDMCYELKDLSRLNGIMYSNLPTPSIISTTPSIISTTILE